jgi:nitrous oxidase accessory protein NosD
VHTQRVYALLVFWGIITTGDGTSYFFSLLTHNVQNVRLNAWDFANGRFGLASQARLNRIAIIGNSFPNRERA